MPKADKALKTECEPAGGYAANETNRVLVWDRGLNTSGSQTIKLVVSGARNPASSGTRVDLDEAALMFGDW